jgi:hypothetical protein
MLASGLHQALNLHMRRPAIICCAMLLSGCASAPTPPTTGANPLGGHYAERKVHDGILQIAVKTKATLWANDATARRSWRARGAEGCKSDNFRELEIKESSVDREYPQGWPPDIVTTREGYAVCDSANLADDAALALIRKGNFKSPFER